MKPFLLISFLSLILATSSDANAIIIDPINSITMDKINKKVKPIPWNKISAISGSVGLILTFIPYLSLLGLILCAASIALGIFSIRKKQKRKWAWIGIITGSLGIVALLAVLGLVLFF